MAKRKTPVLKKEHRISKTYSYQGDLGVKLNFALYIDSKTELVAFVKLLKEAVREVEEDIESMKG